MLAEALADLLCLQELLEMYCDFSLMRTRETEHSCQLLFHLYGVNQAPSRGSHSLYLNGQFCPKKSLCYELLCGEFSMTEQP